MDKMGISNRIRKDIAGNNIPFECVGCAISQGNLKLPGGIIYEGKSLILGADPEIPIPGFLVITIKRHIRSFSELTKEERDEIGDVLSLAEKAIKELGISSEITLVQEERSKHFHIWIFPAYDWMEEKFGVGIKYLRDISNYARNNFDQDTVDQVVEVAGMIRDYIKRMEF